MTTGFNTKPKISICDNGIDYELDDNVIYTDAEGHSFEIPKGYRFQPSIPWAIRSMVPVTAAVVLMSLPHDFLYQTQPAWCTRSMADAIGKEVLQNKHTNKHIEWRVYYGLRWFGGLSWSKNRKKI